MKAFLLLFGLMGFFFLSTPTTATAQSGTMAINYPSDGTFTIVDENGVDDIQRYTDLLNNAELDQYRFENKPRTLAFNNGVKFELQSMRKVYPTDASKVGIPYDEHKKDPVFSIGTVGKAEFLGVTFPVHEKSIIGKDPKNN